ncbi:MAG: heavy metal-associated domain-containing protein [bacterium]|nr:heavy metal-associated domain-containing protein [bacterium]
MANIEMAVEGMTCQMCVRHVREALESLEGVLEATVDLDDKKARIIYDEVTIGLEAMEKAVKDAGYTPA